MEFFVQRIPVHLVFSYISMAVTVGLLLLALLTNRRQAGLSFLGLAASMAFWQFGKLVKNDGFPFWIFGDRDFWSTASFVGATFIYPSLFTLSLQLSGRKLRQWRVPIILAIASAVLMVWMYTQGMLTEGLRLEKYGWYNIPRPLYGLYTLIYSAFMIWGIVLLKRKPPEKIPSQYPSLILFWAATLGFGFGSLEFYSIWFTPLYPLADLSSSLYSLVFYWAIFRFNYLGGRPLLRWFLLRALLFLSVFLIFFASHLAMQKLVPWFERPWVPAVLIALALSSLLPLITQGIHSIRQRYFPAEHSGRDLLLKGSSLMSSSNNPIDMAEQVLSELQRLFHFPRATLILFKSARPSENPPHVISRGIHLSMRRIHDLQSYEKGALSRKELLDSIRQFTWMGAHRRTNLMRSWRLLRRCSADILVPGMSEDGLEFVLLLGEGSYRTEDWSNTKPILEGICKILADHLQLRRMTETRVQEKHLSDLGLMAAGLAHEIKNPLEGVYGAAQLLQEEAKGNLRFVNMILKESMRLNDIVQNFLKFARPFPAEIQSLQVEPFLQTFKDSMAEQGILLSLELPSQSIQVQADPAGVQQILLNLCQNAWRAQNGGEPVLLKVILLPQSLEIQIQDKGPGISGEQSQHLFKPFYTTAAKGNGLGLAMSQKIARAMGGDLFFIPGNQGACFGLRLGRL